MPKWVRASAAVSGPEWPARMFSTPRRNGAVLVLLAPYPRRQIHERRERAVAAGQSPDAAVDAGVQRGALAHQTDHRGGVAGFLDGALETGAGRVGQRIVVAGQRALLDVDRIGQVGGERQEAVLGDVVHPLHHLGNGAPRAGDGARRLEQFDADLGLPAVSACRHGLRRQRQGIDAQAFVLERILPGIDAQPVIDAHLIADLDQPLRQPSSQAPRAPAPTSPRRYWS